MVLDNENGEFGGNGRRLVLLTNGNYSDVRYDYLGSIRSTNFGTYVLNSALTKLSITPSGGERTHLYRFDYGQKQYWVSQADTNRITTSNEDWLRHGSLRTIKP